MTQPERTTKPLNTQAIVEQNNARMRKEIFFLVIQHWYLYLISLVIGFSIYWIINRYSQDIHETKCALMIKDEKMRLSGGELLVSDQLKVPKINSSIQNETYLLKSRGFIAECIEEVNFDISYYGIGKVLETETYGSALPFIIEADSNSKKELRGRWLYLKFEKNKQIKIAFDENFSEKTYQCVLGQMCSISDSIFIKIRLNDNYSEVSGSYKVYFNESEKLINQFRNVISIFNVEKSTVLEVSVSGTLPEKNQDFLNALCHVYERNQVRQKNLITEKTIFFINEQLRELTTTLSEDENELENYKKDNKASVELKDEAKSYYETIKELETQTELYKLDLKDIILIRKEMMSNKDITEIAPSIGRLNDQLLLQLINELRILEQNRKQLAYNTKENFPTFQLINKNIELTRKAILSSLNNNESSIQSRVSQNIRRVAELETKLLSIPSKEREFISLKRRYSVKESLFNYLLERRAELGISKAANLPDHKVVESPFYNGVTYPNRRRNLSISLLLSLL
ncbi:MAG: hypothetical protein KA501_11635, partial [Bacteroidia bacterium]|nr:hypothetical protein [Bacteroidia bacterium]